MSAPASDEALNPNHWTVTQSSDGSPVYTCRVCVNYNAHYLRHCLAHQRSQRHQQAILFSEIEQTEGETDFSRPPFPSNGDELVVDDVVRSIVSALHGNVPSNPPLPLYPENHPSLRGIRLQHDNHWETSPATGIDYGVFEDSLSLDSPPLQEVVTNTTKAIMEILDMDLSDVEWAERSDSEEDSETSDDELYGFDEDDELEEEGPRKRPRGYQSDPQTARAWFPWQDKMTCTLDLLMHLPRSVFSQRQLELFLWLLRVNGIHDVPSVKTMKRINDSLQELCGVESVPYDGVMGNRYYVNKLSKILAQEMANPLVRPNLQFYPEDCAKRVSEAAHGARWLHELSPEDSTPMIRRGGTDYYIHEPAMIVDGSCCVPFRWFRRKGRLFAEAWKMEIHTEVEGQSSWRVREDEVIEVMENLLWKNFPQLKEEYEHLGIPSPTQIHHIFRFIETPGQVRMPETVKWEYTDPTVGNKWRALALGHRVMALPMWLYCDDTSGNVSKRWNEHNSFLFTLAGLPLDHVTKEYNVHFLCTSNLAPPLEMLDGVVSQLEDCRECGVWAWDCKLQELVLVFPSVLALLGDNPMQSELACHIGLAGKYFCRVCWVHGADPPPDQADNVNARTSSRPSSPAPHSTTPPASPSMPPTQEANITETMASMVARIKRFISGDRLRNRNETEDKLRSYFTWAKDLGNLNRIKKEKTATGIKDTLQDFFLDKVHNAYKRIRGTGGRREALEEAFRCLPNEITSPVWRIKGLDPHRDTPVEILHVILLGIVKYFWRDLIHNQLDKKDDKKQLLMHRLSSLDVSALGFSPLRGRTLVQYAGSLTGGDFRAIAQVAPFVIYDLVDHECFEAWNITSAGTSDKYHMPSLRMSSSYSLLKFDQIKCTVNVQHDCFTHHCDTTGFRIVRQERQNTALTTPVVEHRNYAEGLILNLAQMRNASLTSAARVPNPPLDFEATVFASARREVDRRKARAPVTSTSRGHPAPSAPSPSTGRTVGSIGHGGRSVAGTVQPSPLGLQSVASVGFQFVMESGRSESRAAELY